MVGRPVLGPSVPGRSVLGILLAISHVCGMKRPRHLDPPSYLSKSPPVPEPGPPVEQTPPAGEAERIEPTRYGDWEKKGIAIDF